MDRNRMAGGPEKEDPRQKEQEREGERKRRSETERDTRSTTRSRQSWKKRARSGEEGKREREREREREKGSVGGYEDGKEKERDVFLPKGTFCAAFARSSLLDEAAQRDAPRRAVVEIAPVCAVGGEGGM